MSNRQISGVALLAVLALLLWGLAESRYFEANKDASNISQVEPTLSLEQLQSAMPGTPLGSAQESVIPGLIEVTARDRVLYLDQTGRYLVVGSIYDLQEARDLTADRQAELSSMDQISTPAAASIPNLEQLQALSVHYGGEDPGLPQLIIFSDPQCGFCQRLHLELVERTDLRVMELMYPIFPGSQDLAATILCTPDSVTALTRAMQRNSLSDLAVDPTCLESTHQQLSLSLTVGRDLNVHGTPLLLARDPDGQWRRQVGYLPADEILSWMKGAE